LALTVALLAAPSAQAAAPDANFAVDPDPPNEDAPASYEVILQGSGVDSEVEWDFDGDGVYEESGPVVQHTHAEPGKTSVTMRATDEGESTVVTKDIVVNSKPVVSLGFSPTDPDPGEPVLFAADASDDDPMTYRWDFGDGGTATGSGPTHAYSAPGSRTVTLTVTDSEGAVATASLQIEVRAPPSQPAATPGPSAGIRLPAFMSPFPVVRLSGQVFNRVTLIRLLTIRGPRGALVRVRCAGRDCPVRLARRRVRKAGLVRFPVFERSLRPGTRLAIFVRRGAEIGKYTRFAIRAGERPLRTDRCLLPGQRRPVRCPG
jgi:chitodextrinase